MLRLLYWLATATTLVTQLAIGTVIYWVSQKNFLPFVTDEHDDHVAVAVLPGVLQPRRQVVKRVPEIKIVKNIHEKIL